LRVILRDCTILTATRYYKGVDILVEGERISRICRNLNEEADLEINCSRGILVPGVIDPHVHLREPGQEYKEDFSTGTMAALAGGITTVLDMPNNSPPIDSEERLLLKMNKVRKKANVDFGLYITREYSKRAVAMKTYLCETPNVEYSEEYLRDCVSNSRGITAFHAEDQEVINKEGRTLRAEIEGVRRANSFPVEKRYFCHLTSMESTLMANGIVEVTPHHLILSKTDRKEYSVNPPLRDKLTVRSLWTSLNYGYVQVIASDHAPHTEEEKKEGVPGFPGLETLLPSVLTYFQKMRIPLTKAIKLLTHYYKILGIEKGDVIEGYYADLVLLSKKERKVDSTEFFSKCNFSPFEGMKFRYWPIFTMLRGKLAYSEGEIIEERLGKEILGLRKMQSL